MANQVAVAAKRWAALASRRTSMLQDMRMEEEIAGAADNLKALLHNTGQNDESALRKMFDTYDAGNKGYLNMEEWSTALRENGVTDHDMISRALFMRFDLDDSGTLEFHEFVQVLQRTMMTEDGVNGDEVSKIANQLRTMLQQKKKTIALKSLFERYDSDGSGSLDVGEFSQILKELGVGEGATAADLKAVFQMFDSDGSGNIEFDELVKDITSTLNPAAQRKEEAATLASAKQKEREMKKVEDERKTIETNLKERKAKLQSDITDNKRIADDPRQEGMLRMSALQKVQDAYEALEKLSEEEREFFESVKAKENATKLTPEEMRAIRGFKAMEEMKKKVTNSNTFKTAVQAISVGKGPTQTEVKAKKKYMDDTLKNIELEEKGLKDKKAKLQGEIATCREKMQASSTPLVEKIRLSEICLQYTEELDQISMQEGSKQDEWKRMRETLKFTPDEERVWRGIQALTKARAAKPETGAPVNKALANLRRARSGANLSRKREEGSVQDRITAAHQDLKEVEEKLIGLGNENDDEDEDTMEQRIELQQSKLKLQSTLDSLQEKMKGGAGVEDMARATRHRKSVNFRAAGDPTLVAEVLDCMKNLYGIVKHQPDKMKEIFERHDHGTGGLGREDFVLALRDLELSQNDDVLEALFERYDMDGSGQIEYEEFVADIPTESEARDREVDKIMHSLRDVMSQKRGMIALKRLFEKYDTDGSGSLDVDEFQATLQDLGIGKASTASDFRAVFRKFDSDSSGSLELSEFLHAMTNAAKEHQKTEQDALKRVKEKTKLLQKAHEDKSKEEQRLGDRKKELLVEIDLAKKRAENSSTPAMDRIALYEKCVELQEELDQISEDEATFESRWSIIISELTLDENESRLLRGIEAMRKQLEQVKKPTEKTSVSKGPSQQEVKAKMLAYDKAEAIFTVEEMFLKETKRLFEIQIEIGRTANKGEASSALAKMETALLFGTALEDVEAELDEVVGVWNERKQTLSLDKLEQAVSRGITAAEALRKAKSAVPQMILTKAKAKVAHKSQLERGLDKNLFDKNQDLGICEMLKVKTRVALQLQGRPIPPEYISDLVFLQLSSQPVSDLQAQASQLDRQVKDLGSTIQVLKVRVQAARNVQPLTMEEEAAIKVDERSILTMSQSARTKLRTIAKLKGMESETSINSQPSSISLVLPEPEEMDEVDNPPHEERNITSSYEANAPLPKLNGRASQRKDKWAHVQSVVMTLAADRLPLLASFKSVVLASPAARLGAKLSKLGQTEGDDSQEAAPVEKKKKLQLEPTSPRGPQSARSPIRSPMLSSQKSSSFHFVHNVNVKMPQKPKCSPSEFNRSANRFFDAFGIGSGNNQQPQSPKLMDMLRVGL